MTERHLRLLVGTWALRLGLGHLKIDVVITTFDPVEHAAEVNCSPDYDEGRIRIQRWVLTGEIPDTAQFGAGDDPEVLIVHELLHLTVKPMRRYWRALTEGAFLHRDVERLAEEARLQGEEETVDRLANALVASWRTRSV